MVKKSNQEKEETTAAKGPDKKTETTKKTQHGAKDESKSSKLSKELHAKLKEAEEKNKELHDKYLRLSAEFDNFRKRTLKEKTDLIKSAGEQLIVNLLPVIDDFERGINTLSNIKEIESFKEGLMLIYNKFKDFLNQNGVREIEAASKDFNVDLHEAVTKIPAPQPELKGKVVDVITKGYTLNDKVIRYSKVVVGE
ncbi:MAG: nucleotide exchange factor GrpE [Bacteroidales bacterium]|nr:nucleotide exchange factor GrpE [Bacteroidales bacterium]